MDRYEQLKNSGVSAALSAALSMSLSCLIFIAFGFTRAETLVWAVWLGMITFGLSWMGIYIGMAIGQRAGRS